MVWVAGHFGEWLQGQVAGHLALVTLACPSMGAAVLARPAKALGLHDPDRVLGLARARVMLRALDLPLAGDFAVWADLPPGGGAGMSTAALVALARAAAPADAPPPTAARIAAACLRAEGAVDPLMLAAPDAVLWAPRRAEAIRPLPPPPRAAILGGFWGGPTPTDPADLAFPVIDDLIEEWQAGPDLATAARLASLSAARTTALRGPAGDPTAALAARLGALGWARAHTGSARALIFAPGAVPGMAAGAMTATMTAAGFGPVIRFETGGSTGGSVGTAEMGRPGLAESASAGLSGQA